MDFDDKDFVWLPITMMLIVDEIAGAYIAWGGRARLQRELAPNSAPDLK